MLNKFLDALFGDLLLIQIHIGNFYIIIIKEGRQW